MYKNRFDKEPLAEELIVVGKTANVYIRENITAETVMSEEGERTEWVCDEYHARIVASPGIEITDDLKAKIKASDYAETAAKVRAKRDKLLADSDKEVLPDRLTKTSNAFKGWDAYRDALRDLPTQAGFPYNVVWPERP